MENEHNNDDKRNPSKKKLQKTAEEEKPASSNENDDTVCDIENLTADELFDSGVEIKQNNVQPFAFLKDAFVQSEEIQEHEAFIEKRLSELHKRIELNQSVLEKARDYINLISTLEERPTKCSTIEHFQGDVVEVLQLLEKMKKELSTIPSSH